MKCPLPCDLWQQHQCKSLVVLFSPFLSLLSGLVAQEKWLAAGSSLPVARVPDASLLYSALLCVGRSLALFPKHACKCPLFAWPQQKIGSGGTISKIRGDSASAHHSLEVECYGTEDDNWSHWLFPKDAAFPWVNTLPRVCFIHALSWMTSVLLTVKKQLFCAYYNSPATNWEFW